MVPLRKVLCPVDFGQLSKAALATADEITAHFGGELWVLHVVPALQPIPCPAPYAGMVACRAPEYERAVQEGRAQELATLISQLTLKTADVKPVVGCGDAAEEIARSATREEIDLIVMATHGLTGWYQHTFGSVVGKVIHLVHCPVLVIPIPPSTPPPGGNLYVSKRKTGSSTMAKPTVATPPAPSNFLKQRVARVLRLVAPMHRAPQSQRSGHTHGTKRHR